MKIEHLRLEHFMIFQTFEMDWSPNINVICGSNSTGKTVLIKLMYSLLKAWQDTEIEKSSKDKVNTAFVEKLTGVFRPEDKLLGRLAYRKPGIARTVSVMRLADGGAISAEFSSKARSRIDSLSYPDRSQPVNPRNSPIYIPPKEIISSTENFRFLYEEEHIAFEETYNDLTRLLNRPLKKGPNTAQQKLVLEKLGSIMKGRIIQRENKFYLRISEKEEYEMGLVSEGYRKLATIVYLILNGSLNANSVLFWDEPESNMNPRMILPLVETILLLAKLGVQVFLTTHDYFLQQYMNLAASYPQETADHPEIRFVSLYQADGEQTRIAYEAADRVSDLEHNTIMEEFDAIYDREQRMIYGDI